MILDDQLLKVRRELGLKWAQKKQSPNEQRTHQPNDHSSQPTKTDDKSQKPELPRESTHAGQAIDVNSDDSAQATRKRGPLPTLECPSKKRARPSQQRMTSQNDPQDASADPPTRGPAKTDTPKTDNNPTDYTLLTWNVDGLEEKEIVSRTLAVIDQIRKLKPTIVMLQEVTDFTLTFYEKYLSSPYNIIQPSSSTNWTPHGRAKTSLDNNSRAPYFCLLLVSKHHFHLLNPSIPKSNPRHYAKTPSIPGPTYFYPTTKMGRHLLMAKLQLIDHPHVTIAVATSHLESMRPSASERQRQFEVAYHWILGTSETAMTIFGGDLNLRDEEIRGMQQEMSEKGVLDVWEFLGRKSSCQYTWDKKRNVYFQGGSRVRCRFDRLFFRVSKDSVMKVKGLKLVGDELIDPQSMPYHPSDHFGLLCALECAKQP